MERYASQKHSSQAAHKHVHYMMLPTDPLTRTDPFKFPIVTRQLIANFCLVGLATILVGLRFVARRVRKTKIWWDDAAAVLALIMTLCTYKWLLRGTRGIAAFIDRTRLLTSHPGLLAIHVLFANYGLRYHLIELPRANQIYVFQKLLLFQAIYYVGMTSVKLSYLWFYLRIFPQQNFRRWVWICMGLVAGYFLGSMLQIFLLCRPFEMNWNHTIPGGHCGNSKLAFVTIGVFNMLTDFIIMLLPVPFLRKLQMATGTKLGLAAIFGIGLLVTAITIIRITVLLDIEFRDVSYYTDAAFWSVAEPAIAVINVCIATLRPLLTIISPTRFWASRKRNTTDLFELSEEAGSAKRQKRKPGVEYDEYPLAQNEDGVMDTTVTCGDWSCDTKGYATSDHSMKITSLPGSSWEGEQEQQSRHERIPSVHAPERGRIFVQQDFRIQSSGRDSL